MYSLVSYEASYLEHFAPNILYLLCRLELHDRIV
jgi:hypothetical protein